MRALKTQPVAADLRYDQRGDALWGLSEAPGKFEKSSEVWKQKKVNLNKIIISAYQLVKYFVQHAVFNMSSSTSKEYQ